MDAVLTFIGHALMAVVILGLTMVALFAAGFAGRGSDAYQGPAPRRRVVRHLFWNAVDFVFHAAIRLLTWIIDAYGFVVDVVESVRERRRERS